MSGRQRVPSTAPWTAAVGYSRAVRVGSHVFVAGTAPVDDDGRVVHPGDPYLQARRCFEIVLAALRAAGAGPEHVVRTRMYVVRPEDWEPVGRAHREVFGEVRPATTLVAVAGFVDPAIRVEVEADAVLDAGGA